MARAVYDLQPPNRRTTIGKRREAVSGGGIMQFDDAMLESELDAMIRTRVENAANAMRNASGRRDHGRRRIRALDRSEGVPGRRVRGERRHTGRRRNRRGRPPRTHPRERHDQTAEPGDPPAHARRGRLPGRERRVDARMRRNPLRHRERGWSTRRYPDMPRLDDSLMEAN